MQTFGHAPDNEIVASRFVSGHHTRFAPEGSAHRIVDMGSRNALLFEGRRITERSLRDGDVLRIGDATTDEFVTLKYHNPHIVQPAHVPQRYRLDANDPQITIGRDVSDVILGNPQVSRNHARIDRIDGKRRRLQALGSTNGTYANRRRITLHEL